MRRVFEWLDNLDPMMVLLALAVVLLLLYLTGRRTR